MFFQAKSLLRAVVQKLWGVRACEIRMSVKISAWCVSQNLNSAKGDTNMNTEKLLDLKNITLSYDGDKILDNVNLYVRDKEFVTFLGPSGCGKTTTLRIIGGFAFPDEGDVYFDG